MITNKNDFSLLSMYGSAACHPEMAKCTTTKDSWYIVHTYSRKKKVHDESRDGLFLHSQGRV
jgi:hypothetical protein